MTIDDLIALPVGTALTTIGELEAEGVVAIASRARMIVVENDAVMPSGRIVLRLHPTDFEMVTRGAMPLFGHSLALPQDDWRPEAFPFKRTPFAFAAGEAAAAMLTHRLSIELGEDCRTAANRLHDVVGGTFISTAVQDILDVLDIHWTVRGEVTAEALRLTSSRFMNPPASP